MGIGYTAGVVVLTAIGVTFLPKLLTPTVPVQVSVETAPGWEKLGDVFKNIIEENPARGYAFAVHYKGELVVDLYGGYADAQAWAPWREDTLGMLFSATKTISSICIALLVDRGLLDYKKPIAEYWPEFDDAGHGRESITVEMLLSQQAGLVTFDEEWSVFDILNDPEKITKLLLKNKPDWSQVHRTRTQHGYHLLTFGLYINEIIMRVDPQHRTLDQFFLDEIGEPLEMDAMIGLPLEENYRTIRILPATTGLEDLQGLLLDNGWRLIAAVLSSNSLIRRGFYKEIGMDGLVNNPEFRRIPLGASHAFGTARDFAKLYGVLSSGGKYNSRTFVSEDLIKGLAEEIISGVDSVMGVPVSFGRGTSIIPTPAGSVKFGFPGAGGMMAYGDIKYQLGFAFLTTKMYTGLGPSPQYQVLEKAMYECVQNIQKGT